MITMKGVILPIGISPITGRNYPLDVVKEAVASFNGTYSNRGTMCLGQLDDGDQDKAMAMDITKASHCIRDCYISEDETHVIAEIEILTSTPRGKLVAELLDDESTTSLKLSPIMSGNIKGDNEVYNLQLLRVDLSLTHK